MICHYWVFNQGVKFQDSVCNGCPDVTVFSINVDDIAIITVKNVDCRCIIHYIYIYEKIALVFNLLKTVFF